MSINDMFQALDYFHQDQARKQFFQIEFEIFQYILLQTRWLGGYVNAKGEAVTGFKGLQQELCPHFELVEQVDMPFFIRETARKNQWTVAHATVWRRK